jgi:hypothetical protein
MPQDKGKEKKSPSQKQLNIRAIADIVSVAMDRHLKPSEWGQIGKMINNFGFEIVKDAAEMMAKSKLSVEDKRKGAIPYMYGCLKRSKVESNRDSSLIDGILENNTEL